jgi:hypothetical protein
MKTRTIYIDPVSASSRPGHSLLTEKRGDLEILTRCLQYLLKEGSVVRVFFAASFSEESD